MSYSIAALKYRSTERKTNKNEVDEETNEMCTIEPIEYWPFTKNKRKKKLFIGIPTAQHTENGIINQMFSKHLKFWSPAELTQVC